MRANVTARAFGILLGALVGCGTLGSSSHGDVDLPLSSLGPFRSLGEGTSPTNSSELIGGGGGISLDEPSAVRFSSKRFVYMTLSRRQGDRTTVSIALANERTGMNGGALLFDDAREVFAAEQMWEGGSVAAPGALVIDEREVLLVYEAGGAIGLARSMDGERFTRRSEPILRADSMRGEGLRIGSPSLARDASGTYWLAYAGEGKLFLARSMAPEGPWVRVGTGAVLEPLMVRDAGVMDFESRALGDPALTIERTPAGRELFLLFYSAMRFDGGTTISAAGSYNGEAWRRIGRVLYPETVRASPIPAFRAGSFERLDDRTTLLWVGAGSATRRFISAGLGPPLPRAGSSIPN